ncbi:MAG: 3-phosphoshikimate 1-carboxyvinyltransferase [Flavobacteriales bacterium]
MPTSVTIHKPEGRIRASVRLPRSKSVANRALILASIASLGRSKGEGVAGDLDRLKDAGDADDTRILHRLLTERPAVMHCGAGGTTFRFLLAWACVQEGGDHVITGDTRLLERPHEPLIDALRQLGANIERTAMGYHVRGRQLNGGAITFDSPISSQFISAVLLIAPTFSHELYLRWTGNRLSEPYVAMTLKMLAHFGVVPRMELDGVRIVPGPLSSEPFTVPPDWSVAAFWFQIAALSRDAEILLEGLDDDTLQGDYRAQELWMPWVSSAPGDGGILLRSQRDPSKALDEVVDLKRTPDLFQPLVITCAASGVSVTFTGLDNLAHKETDRLKAVTDALRKMGSGAGYEEDRFILNGPITGFAHPPFDPKGDHRMAMALAPLALVRGSIALLHPEVVNKSYPTFWDDLAKAGFGIEYHG